MSQASRQDNNSNMQLCPGENYPLKNVDKFPYFIIFTINNNELFNHAVPGLTQCNIQHKLVMCVITRPKLSTWLCKVVAHTAPLPGV